MYICTRALYAAAQMECIYIHGVCSCTCACICLYSTAAHTCAFTRNINTCIMHVCENDVRACMLCMNSYLKPSICRWSFMCVGKCSNAYSYLLTYAQIYRKLLMHYTYFCHTCIYVSVRRYTNHLQNVNVHICSCACIFL